MLAGRQFDNTNRTPSHKVEVRVFKNIRWVFMVEHGVIHMSEGILFFGSQKTITPRAWLQHYLLVACSVTSRENCSYVVAGEESGGAPAIELEIMMH